MVHPTRWSAAIVTLGMRVCSAFAGSSNVVVSNAFPNLTFEAPVDIAAPDDGTNRLFVVEQVGRIVVFDNAPNATTKTTFLDITDRVAQLNYTQGQVGGILGLAFHPDYASNGYLYVTYMSGTIPNLTANLVRYQVSATDANFADPATESVVLQVPQTIANHNMHRIVFGPDNYLYVSVGDGGCCGDPFNTAQNRGDLRGSILRLDVDNPAPGLGYGIPNDNPFTNNGFGWREEIYAYGLRNPWEMSFDTTGRLWVGDVGQDGWEEVNWVIPAANHGWPITEASSCFDPPTCSS
ncbi:MAG: PQQ-dependent sugar dehydrogenase, partial [Planctomycetota bacterium]